MINAKEANRRTYEAVSLLQDKAMQWVEDEWEFVEAKIYEAIERGEFEASYWWSNELLKEAGVKKQYAAEALSIKAYDLGFSKQVWQNYSNSNVLRIELYWEKV